MNKIFPDSLFWNQTILLLEMLKKTAKCHNPIRRSFIEKKVNRVKKTGKNMAFLVNVAVMSVRDVPNSDLDPDES